MSSYALIDDRSNIEIVSSILTSFLSNSSEIASLDVSKKSELVSALLSDLDENGVQLKWNDDVRLLALQTLKTLGRNVNGCELLFSDKGFLILLSHASLLSNDVVVDTPVAQEALTCIANALLLEEDTRDLFEKHNCISKICLGLKDVKISIKTQFLYSRILFLVTIKTSPIVKQLIDDLKIIDILHNTINNLVKEISSSTIVEPSPSPITRVTLLNEQLKFLFNLMHYDPKIVREEGKGKNQELPSKFEKLLPIIIKIITELPPPSPLPLSPPHSHAIHALLNFPVTPYKSIWFPPEQKTQQYALLNKFLETLKTMIFIAVNGDPDVGIENGQQKYGVNFDEVIPPLVALIRKLAEEDELARINAKNILLPDDPYIYIINLGCYFENNIDNFSLEILSDRSKPLEKGDDLSARLIRLMTSAMLPNLKDGVSELLYVICDQDVNLFIHHVGYGNAAGFLMNRNIMVPPLTSSSKQKVHSDKSINPITGQYLENEAPSLSDMTDEEKEREAERLFVLFERLKKTGVMNVVNPVEEAAKSGKINEIIDDEEKEESD
ncbi:guanine nucleotide exchange factor [Gigaspora rosea]|uniref:Guanine nucleotide exchange factor n=1 Tax=Gigaspora rosea TaxID=44941 RepID=A0A397VED5_9GLOM|nr:guanine nucleotide exchange factor [Gigaspora rosea]